MKRKFAWGAAIIAAIAWVKFVGMSYAGECKTLENETKALIASVQRCEADQDCTFQQLTCPFPCITPLRRDAKGQVTEAVNSYNKKCMMMCPDCAQALPARMACVNNTCVGVS